MPPRQVFMLDDQDDIPTPSPSCPRGTTEFIGVKAFTYFPTTPAPNTNRSIRRSCYSTARTASRSHSSMAPASLSGAPPASPASPPACSPARTRRHSSSCGTGNLSTYIIRANASVRPLKRSSCGAEPSKRRKSGRPDGAEFPGIKVEVARRRGRLRRRRHHRRRHRLARTGRAGRLDQARHPHRLHRQPPRHQTRVRYGADREIESLRRQPVNAFKEAGEILVPISEGVFRKKASSPNSPKCAPAPRRCAQNDEEITLFKSIGMAMSDLVGAGLAYKRPAAIDLTPGAWPRSPG